MEDVIEAREDMQRIDDVDHVFSAAMLLRQALLAVKNTVPFPLSPSDLSQDKVTLPKHGLQLSLLGLDWLKLAGGCRGASHPGQRRKERSPGCEPEDPVHGTRHAVWCDSRPCKNTQTYFFGSSSE